jgi:hypothetical protein
MLYGFEWRRQRALGALDDSEWSALLWQRWANWAFGVGVALAAAAALGLAL